MINSLSSFTSYAVAITGGYTAFAVSGVLLSNALQHMICNNAAIRPTHYTPQHKTYLWQSTILYTLTIVGISIAIGGYTGHTIFTSLQS